MYATSDLACVLDRVERLDADLLAVRRRRAAGAALPDGVRGGAHGGLAERRRPKRCTCRSAVVLGDGPQDAAQPQWRLREAHRAARRGGRTSGRGRSPRRTPTSTPTQRADGGADDRHRCASSTPTCRPTASRTTSSTGTGCSSFDGNTAPYLQYAHARICSIFRRAEVERGAVRSATIALGTPQERALALRVLALPTRARRRRSPATRRTSCAPTCSTWRQDFTAFYEHCPVLRADEPLRTSRLALCRPDRPDARARPRSARHRSPGADVTTGTFVRERAPTPTAARHRRRRRRRVADGRRVLGRATWRRVRHAAVRLRRSAPPGTAAARRSPRSATSARSTRPRRSCAGRWRGSRTTRGCCSTSRPAASCTSRSPPACPRRRA